MSLINATSQLNQIARSAYKNPHRALEELSRIELVPEIAHLRDAVLFHIHALRKIDLQKNRKKVKKAIVTRVVEARVRTLFAYGTSQTEIADIMRLSLAAVNLLVHGKYKFPQSEALKPKKILKRDDERRFEAEYTALLARTGKQDTRGAA